MGAHHRLCIALTCQASDHVRVCVAIFVSAKRPDTLDEGPQRFNICRPDTTTYIFKET